MGDIIAWNVNINLEFQLTWKRTVRLSAKIASKI